MTQHLSIESLTAALSNLGPQIERRNSGAGKSIVRLGEEISRLRYRMLIANMARTRTFEEAQAFYALDRAKRIRNGALRHRRVKAARDELRHARKQALTHYPS